jgi:hypothetical protein
MNWLEDSEHFEQAHRTLDDAGRFIRQSFGCTLAFKDGAYRQDCPVALAHNRIWDEHRRHRQEGIMLDLPA